MGGSSSWRMGGCCRATLGMAAGVRGRPSTCTRVVLVLVLAHAGLLFEIEVLSIAGKTEL